MNEIGEAILLTGVTGVLDSELLPRLLRQYPQIAAAFEPTPTAMGSAS